MEGERSVIQLRRAGTAYRYKVSNGYRGPYCIVESPISEYLLDFIRGVLSKSDHRQSTSLSKGREVDHDLIIVPKLNLVCNAHYVCRGSHNQAV